MTIEQRAKEWTRETTFERCKTCDCAKCAKRHCDYKSRVEAYKQGWSDALWQIEERQAVEELKFTQGFAYREPWRGHLCRECRKWKTDLCGCHDLRGRAATSNACHEFEMIASDD